MKKTPQNLGWTRSRPFRNFMAGWLASSLAVPLFVLADSVTGDSAGRAPAEESASPSPSPAASAAAEDEPSADELREEYVSSLGEREFSCSRDVERARRDVKAHRGLLGEDTMAEVLAALDEEELKIYSQKLEEAASLEELSELVGDLDEFADARCELIRKSKRGKSDSRRHSRRLSRSEKRDDDSSVDRTKKLQTQMPLIANLYRLTALKQLRTAHVENQQRRKEDQAMGLAPFGLGGDQDPFELARQTLGKAQDISCLDGSSKQRLSGYQRDLTIMACEDQASMGSIAAWSVNRCTQNLKVGLIQELQEAAYLPNGGSMERINTIATALDRVNGITGKMRQADEEKQKILLEQAKQAQQTQQLLTSLLSGGSASAQQGSGGLFSMGSYGGSSSTTTTTPPLPGVTPLPSN